MIYIISLARNRFGKLANITNIQVNDSTHRCHIIMTFLLHNTTWPKQYACSYTSSSLQCVPDSTELKVAGNEFISARDSHMQYMQYMQYMHYMQYMQYMEYMQGHMHSTFAKLLNEIFCTQQ